MPLSLLYGGILRIRHFLYDRGLLSSYKPVQATIVVGNLALGGTGKTPLIDFIASRLNPATTAILSRGYGRTTRGTILIRTDTPADQCGDEPLQLKKRHPQVTVLVDEDRTSGLEYLRKEFPQIKTVLLDDAFQHRRVKGDLQLLLTTYDQPYFSDYLLPAGNLRDLKSRSKVADGIIVTKCPKGMKKSEKLAYSTRLRSSEDQSIWFSEIGYERPKRIWNGQGAEIDEKASVVLVSGIARPEPFVRMANEIFRVERHFKFGDHHTFKSKDLFRLRDFIDTFEGRKPVVLTTEKDAMRLEKFRTWFEENDMEIWIWPIRMDFGEATNAFESLIKQYADKS